MTDIAYPEEQAFGRGGGGDNDGLGQGGGEGDRRALQEFLRRLAADLDAMAEEEEFLSPAGRELAQQAFSAGPRAIVDFMIARLDDPSVEDDLERHGLTGAQLRFKLGAHAFARRHTLEAVAGGAIAPGFTDVAGEEYLKCSDVILESLSAALGGAGGVLIEFKKMIEWLKGFAGRFGFRL